MEKHYLECVLLVNGIEQRPVHVLRETYDVSEGLFRLRIGKESYCDICLDADPRIPRKEILRLPYVPSTISVEPDGVYLIPQQRFYNQERVPPDAMTAKFFREYPATANKKEVMTTPLDGTVQLISKDTVLSSFSREEDCYSIKSWAINLQFGDIIRNHWKGYHSPRFSMRVEYGIIKNVTSPTPFKDMAKWILGMA
jgi:hypothetical protein